MSKDFQKYLNIVEKNRIIEGAYNILKKAMDDSIIDSSSLENQKSEILSSNVFEPLFQNEALPASDLVIDIMVESFIKPENKAKVKKLFG
ncbi:hypothetical protein HGB47_14950 [Leptospira yasudae]|uniref:hypothetical protein n=1 Tax=Leptospira yasudae TaxID=2202201 RepID=UPI001C4E53CD|nr:hypothetical protein [Leptospira yasudae]MBW0434915.1 hypothetical protein [Leptospira yasudae]